MLSFALPIQRLVSQPMKGSLFWLTNAPIANPINLVLHCDCIMGPVKLITV